MSEPACQRFVGRVALVTGAASGIGAATALRLAQEGAAVILSDRNHAGAENTRAALPAAHRHLALHHDVTEEAQWQAVLARIMESHGRLDVLVNNAGMGRPGTIAETSLADWRALLAVNLDSVFLGIKLAMPLLAASGRGAVVNLSSIRAHAATPGAAPYCAAKSGVTMLTKAAALECAEAGNGVRVNSIHPGFVRTGLAASFPPEAAARAAGAVPVGRLAEAGEVAAAIAFLASDDASYMTGSEVVVDGALTAR